MSILAIMTNIEPILFIFVLNYLLLADDAALKSDRKSQPTLTHIFESNFKIQTYAHGHFNLAYYYIFVIFLVIVTM